MPPNGRHGTRTHTHSRKRPTRASCEHSCDVSPWPRSLTRHMCTPHHSRLRTRTRAHARACSTHTRTSTRTRTSTHGDARPNRRTPSGEPRCLTTLEPYPSLHPMARTPNMAATQPQPGHLHEHECTTLHDTGNAGMALSFPPTAGAQALTTPFAGDTVPTPALCQREQCWQTHAPPRRLRAHLDTDPRSHHRAQQAAAAACSRLNRSRTRGHAGSAPLVPWALTSSTLPTWLSALFAGGRLEPN